MRNIDDAYAHAKRKGIIDKYGAPIKGSTVSITTEKKSVGAVMAEVTDSHTPEPEKTILTDRKFGVAQEPAHNI